VLIIQNLLRAKAPVAVKTCLEPDRPFSNGESIHFELDATPDGIWPFLCSNRIVGAGLDDLIPSSVDKDVAWIFMEETKKRLVKCLELASQKSSTYTANLKDLPPEMST
jgi:hypothetical protein